MSLPLFTKEHLGKLVILFPIPHIGHVSTTFTGREIPAEMKGGSYIRRENLKMRGTEQCFLATLRPLHTANRSQKRFVLPCTILLIIQGIKIFREREILACSDLQLIV